MTIQTASIAVAPKQHRTRFITAAAGAVLALTAAAGLGAGQMSRDGGTSDGDQQAASRRVVPTEAGTIYLAGSQAQADAIRATLDADAAHAHAGNARPSPAAAVTAIASEQDLERLMRLVGATDEVNAAHGLPVLQVVDRRAS